MFIHSQTCCAADHRTLSNRFRSIRAATAAGRDTGGVMLVRRLGTSAAQLYRLLDQTNYRKSVDQVLALLQVLDCEVDLVIRTRSA